MNPIINFLIDVLYHRIKLNDGRIVPIIKRPYPVDKIPCITLDTQSTTYNGEYITYNPQENLCKEYEGVTVINLWCNDEDDRQSMIFDVEDCFNKVQLDNYTYCVNYTEDGICKSLLNPCPVPVDRHALSCTHRCPRPEQYHYQNLFTKHMIDRYTLNVNQGVDNDEYDKEPPILRTMITMRAHYLVKYCNDGKVSRTLEYEDKLL